VFDYTQRSVPNRALRSALGWVLVSQVAWLASTYYMNCGAASAAPAGVGVTPCQPKIFAVLGSILQRFNEVGALPAAAFVPDFNFARVPRAPGWLVEWGPTLTLTVVNGLLWTLVLGTVIAGVMGVRSLTAPRAVESAPRPRSPRHARSGSW
jgi:hypothetical protein